ncbi:unnamed protein product [Hermetia illucens]|uniref:Gustatory receptor n=1 Tax=Hermetia illucens TaxID=343691 RepID=A0A7R8YNY3_HERIL|nr:unnamed protein product [Hermetia illucens]
MLSSINRLCLTIVKIALVDSQIVGVSAYSYNETLQTVAYSRVLRVYTYIITTIVAATFTWIPLQLTDTEWQSYRCSTYALVNAASFTFLMLLAISAISKHLMMQKRIISVVKTAISIVKNFNLRIGANIFDPDCRSLLIAKAVIDLIQRFLEVYVLIQMLTVSDAFEFILWILACHITHMADAMLNEIFVFMLFVRQGFKLCAREIQVLFVELEGHPVETRQKLSGINLHCKASDEIDEIMSLWTSTYEIYCDVQLIFNFQNLALISCHYWNTVLQLYQGFVANINETPITEQHSFLEECLFGMFAFCELALFVVVASSAGECSSEVRGQFERILDLPDIDERLVQNAEGHILGLLLKESHATVYRLFRLDKNALLQLFSATILYLTIIIQFHKTQ